MNKLSIIITCYNNSATIQRAINSCKKVNVENEIIVIDDKSTDNSLEILKKCQDIKLIQLHKNCGVGFARNIGAANSSYEKLLFLDGDDELLDGVEGLMGVIDNYDLAYGDLILNETYFKLCDESRISDIMNVNPLTSVFVCKRNVFDAVGGYSEDREVYEDWSFLIKAFNLKFRFKYVSGPVFLYHRTHEGRYSNMLQKHSMHKAKTQYEVNKFLLNKI